MAYTRAAVERAMKVQEAILRALSGRQSWLQVADVLGVSPLTVRRLRWRYERARVWMRAGAGSVASSDAPASCPRSSICSRRSRRGTARWRASWGSPAWESRVWSSSCAGPSAE
jgi:hypothetical protein